MIVTNGTDIDTAKNTCESIGFHLVYIETSQEQDYLVSTLNDSSIDRDFWIGIGKDSAGNPVWMDGSQITFSNFDASNGSGDCYQLYQAANYEWRDLGCGDGGVMVAGYICERYVGTGNFLPPFLRPQILNLLFIGSRKSKCVFSHGSHTLEELGSLSLHKILLQ